MQERYNLALSFGCSRWHGQDGFAQAIHAQSSTTDKVNLSSNT